MKFKISSKISPPGLKGKTLPTPSLGMWTTATWPYHTGILSTVYSFYVIMNLASTILFEMSAALEIWRDIPLFCTVSSTIVTGLHSLGKLIYFSLRQNELKKLIEKFYTNIWKQDYEDPKIYEETENKMILSNIFSLCMVTSLSLFCTMPYIETFSYEYKDKLFPFKIRYPFDIMVPVTYEIIYIETAIAGYYAVASILGPDTILNYFLVYSCRQIEVIHNEIILVGNKMTAKERTEEDDKTISERFGSLISRHSAIIGFVDDMEELFSPSIFIQFVTTSLVICILGIQLVFFDRNVLIMVKTVLFLSSIVGQLFINCFAGQRLIDSNLKIADAVYSMNWVDLNKNIHKNVVIILQRSQKPLNLTAYKFFSLSMESFTSICSTAGSYFALCKTLIEE